MNIALVIAYDGTSFLGWQKTKMGKSIEEELENALCQILSEKIELQAASRTDRGVHATGQVVNFFTTKSPCLDALQRGINGLLPPEIRVLSVTSAPLTFHPTIDAVGKHYTYYLDLKGVQLPFHRDKAWHVPYPIDLQKIEEALSLFMGTHDFTSFCNQRKNLNYSDYTRTIKEITLRRENDLHRIDVMGNSFLYKMVRNIVGTLVYVGCGKIEVSEIYDILNAKDRERAGVTAPSHALFLTKIFYPEGLFS